MDLHELPDQPFSRHPWEIARAHFFRALLASRGGGDLPRRILDVGAGDGYLASELLATMPAGTEVVCFDTNYTDAQLAKPGKAGLSFTRERPAGPFDLILLLDVIEHVTDDRGLLAEASGALAEGGHVLVSVPAWGALYTKHDLFLGHHRRYRPAQLRAVVDAAGLRLEAGGGLFHSLLLVRAAQKLAELGRGVWTGPVLEELGSGDEAGVGRWKGGAGLTRAIGALLALDNQLSVLTASIGFHLPGLSIWALCRKG